MPALFDKLGIRFLYPDNWTLDEGEVLEGNSMVSVYSPGGAFWSVILHPPGLDPEDLVEAAVDTMRQEYDDLDADAMRESIAGHDVVGSEMNFYCLDLTNTAVVRSYATDEATYLVLCQADDREYQQVAAVLDAITLSLLDPRTSSASFAHRPAALASGEAADR